MLFKKKSLASKKFNPIHLGIPICTQTQRSNTMKKQLLALSLVATCGLVAQEGAQPPAAPHQSSSCNTCRCNPCCCEPCCVPKPKKCIDCECYTPQYYDLQCDWGTFISADFLYWYGRETNLSYSQRFAMLPDNAADADTTYTAFPQNYNHLKSKWDPGVRVALGFNSECDGWDWSIVWTYFRNKSSKTSTTTFDEDSTDPLNPLGFPLPNQQALLNPWVNAAVFGGGEIFSPVFDRVKAKWKLSFNQIDLELGRKYWLSQCFTMRPYTAVRGMWTKTNFDVTGSLGPRATSDAALAVNFEKNSSDRFENKYWGVGFLTGIQPNWYFCRTFVMYGNLDAALVWGDFKGRKKESYLIQGESASAVPSVEYNVSNTTKEDDFGRMLGMIDVAIGLRWEDTYCCDRYRFGLDLGWEHHLLINAGLRYKSIDFDKAVSGSTPDQDDLFYSKNYQEVRSDIGMGGFVLRVRFDF